MPRVFIALDLPDEARAALAKVQERLREENLFTRTYTAPEHLHLTLKFLGEISDDELAWVRERLRTVSARSFTASLGGAGTFKRRIVWIRLHGAGPLQHAIDAALKQHHEEEARFMGHITIARPKDLREGAVLAPIVRKIEVPQLFFPVDHFTLYTSQLTAQGPVYTVVERVPIR